MQIISESECQQVNELKTGLQAIGPNLLPPEDWEDDDEEPPWRYSGFSRDWPPRVAAAWARDPSLDPPLDPIQRKKDLKKLQNIYMVFFNNKNVYLLLFKFISL